MLYHISESFEWDDAKADKNFRKHGVRFSEAATLWRDGKSLEIHDPAHSTNEDRSIRLGVSSCGNILVVVFLDRAESGTIRIISARPATLKEQTTYFTR